MKKELAVIIFFVLLCWGAASGAVHVDIAGGYSLQSKYQYFGDEPSRDGSQWMTFDPINNFCASSRISIDIWKDLFRFGITGGFVRRHELNFHTLNNDAVTSKKTGEMLSIPVIGFLEGRHRSFFYEFGLGPYITRINYTGGDYSGFDVFSLFGFLFGGGYEYTVLKNVKLQIKGELLVNAPVFLVDFLNARLKNELHESRYPEYNGNDFQSVIYNATISVGLQYEFGNTVRIPLDSAVGALVKRWKKSRQ
jgi:hypothetical protein